MNAAQKKAFVLRMARARALKRSTGAKSSSRGTRTKKAAPRTGTRRRPKKNPDELAAAEEMYTEFHGRPPHRIIEYDQDHQYRAELAELGKLIELRFQVDETHDQPLLSFGEAQVTCTPDGRNLYIIGGRQALDLDKLGIESNKDYVELGPLTYIKYHTYKGFHDFQPIDYYHSFGEQDGVLPVLAYDSVNQALFIIGGNYECRPEGIVN